MKAIIRVDLKPGVLDPQGQAVAQALRGLGFDEVADARQGKIIELDLDERDPSRARERVEAMCQRLLANPVIERFAIDLVAETDAPA